MLEIGSVGAHRGGGRAAIILALHWYWHWAKHPTNWTASPVSGQQFQSRRHEKLTEKTIWGKDLEIKNGGTTIENVSLPLFYLSSWIFFNLNFLACLCDAGADAMRHVWSSADSPSAPFFRVWGPWWNSEHELVPRCSSPLSRPAANSLHSKFLFWKTATLLPVLLKYNWNIKSHILFFTNKIIRCATHTHSELIALS